MPDEPKHFRKTIAAPKSGIIVIVEDGTCIPNSNSYIDVAYADSYHSMMVYNDAWEAALPDTKSAAIINATRLIDANMIFNGYLVQTNQSLKWPRQQCPNDEIAPYPYGYPSGYVSGLGSYTFYPMNEIPKTLKDAVAVEALEVLRLGVDPAQVDMPPFGIQALRVADIDITYMGGGYKSVKQAPGSISPLTPSVQRLLMPLGNIISSGFGSSAVVRVA